MTAPHVGNTGVNDEDDESRPHLGRRLRRARPRAAPVQLARPAHPGGRARRAGRRRHLRHRHPRPDPPPARARRDAGRHLLRRGRAAARRASCCARGRQTRRRWPARPSPPRSPPTEAYVVPAVGERRFTVAAVDLGIKAMTPHLMAERGIEVHVLPADRDLRRRSTRSASRPGRGLLLQRPRRPGDRRRTRSQLLREVLDARHPVLRHLLRQPAPRPGARLRHLQAEVRPPRHQPARAWTAPPARSRSPRTTTASPSTRPLDGATATTPPAYGRGPGHPRLPQRRRRRGAGMPRHACLLGAVPPRGRGRPARRRLPLRPLRRADDHDARRTEPRSDA